MINNKLSAGESITAWNKTSRKTLDKYNIRQSLSFHTNNTQFRVNLQELQENDDSGEECTDLITFELTCPNPLPPPRKKKKMEYTVPIFFV